MADEDDVVSAEIVDILGRGGMHGEAIQVRCKILEGANKGRVVTRNCRGPARKGDTLMLMEPTREARRLSAR